MSKVKQTPFEEATENGKQISMNGKIIPYYKYQLAVHKRDLALWKIGMKINRNFKVTDYKKYYGIKGKDGQAVYDAFMKQIYEKWMI